MHFVTGMTKAGSKAHILDKHSESWVTKDRRNVGWSLCGLSVEGPFTLLLTNSGALKKAFICKRCRVHFVERHEHVLVKEGGIVRWKKVKKKEK